MIRKVLAFAMSAALSVPFSSCGKKNNPVKAVNVAKDFSDSSGTEKEFTFDTGSNISTLDISEDIGNITISSSDTDKTVLTLGCRSFSDDMEVCEDILSRISAEADINGGKIVISFIEEESGQDITQWLSENIPDSRIELDAQLSVPSYISEFITKVNVGNISLTDLKGGFSAYADVGNINGFGLEVTSGSALGCNTGNVTLGKNIYNADLSVNIYTGITTFALPETGSGNAEIQISSKTGRINIDTNEKDHNVTDEKKLEASHALTISSQNCNIEASVETGKITLDQEEK